MIGDVIADGLETKFRRVRILDFDCECRPMSWYGGDFNTKEITAIAWRFVDSAGATGTWLLSPSKTWRAHQAKKREGLEEFLRAYHLADIVTGHYIRGFDLPLLNASCFRLGLPPLPAKLTEDTKGDLMKMQGLSKSQQNLSSMLDLGEKKEHMNAHLWEVANSLVKEGRDETRRRVKGDVHQHITFRSALLDRGALSRPKMWYPHGDKSTAAYVG